jgi:predicted membrane protein
MSEQKRPNDVGRIVFGLAIVALGVIFTLGNLGVIVADDYWRYWPVILIAFGFGKLFERRGSGGKMFGFTVGVVGVLLLLERLGKIAWDVWDLWPLVLVLFGISILVGGRGKKHQPFCRTHVGWRQPPDAPSAPGGDAEPTSSHTDAESTIHVATTFGGTSRVVTSQDFRGGSISTIMGGCEIDLRGASIAGSEAVIHVSVVFGGVELRVPESWRVTSEINPVLGGVEVKTPHTIGPGAKTLALTGSVVLGGIEVKSS